MPADRDRHQRRDAIERSGSGAVVAFDQGVAQGSQLVLMLLEQAETCMTSLGEP
jgi:hypothetical protein